MLKKIQYKNLTYFQNTSLFRMTCGARIGIFGGSFNPAHKGHVHLSTLACKILKLDFIIWLVTPENPLKKNKNYNLSIKERLKIANQLTKHNFNIKVLCIEEAFDKNYSYLTLNKIKELSNNNTLIWLMGDDNLEIFHNFKFWQNMIEEFNICVFARKKESFSSLLSKSSLLYKKQQLSYYDDGLLDNKKKFLKFCLTPKNPLSSTKIRNMNEKNETQP
jgi:nicotinate-nucleotide adenylyltransferase